MNITPNDIGRRVRLRNGREQQIVAYINEEKHRHPVILDDGVNYSKDGKYNAFNTFSSNLDIIEFVDELERADSNATPVNAVNMNANAAATRIAAANSLVEQFRSIQMPTTNSKLEPYQDRLDMSIHITSAIVSVLVREGVYTQDQAQLLFDRISDKLAEESVRTLIGVLPKTGSSR